MSFINSIRNYLLQRFEIKVANYSRIIVEATSSVNHIDVVFLQIRESEGVREVFGNTEELTKRMNLDLLESIKRDLKIAMKSCEMMEEEIDEVDFESMKWWDFSYLDRIAKREKNVISSLRKLYKHLNKFSTKTSMNFL